MATPFVAGVALSRWMLLGLLAVVSRGAIINIDWTIDGVKNYTEDPLIVMIGDTINFRCDPNIISNFVYVETEEQYTSCNSTATEGCTIISADCLASFSPADMFSQSIERLSGPNDCSVVNYRPDKFFYFFSSSTGELSMNGPPFIGGQCLDGLKMKVFVCDVPTSNEVVIGNDTGAGYIYRLSVTQDVWLERSNQNYNNYSFIIVGKHPYYPLKRSLLQFQDLPDTCTHIKWAKMYIYFIYAHKASFLSLAQVPYISRPLQVHQVKRQWSESQATTTIRLNGHTWSQPWLALDGTDADPNGILCQPVTINTYRPSGFIELDITEAVRNWKSGDPNYGVLLMATNEDSNGRDIRFASNANSNTDWQAYVNVLCN